MGKSLTTSILFLRKQVALHPMGESFMNFVPEQRTNPEYFTPLYQLALNQFEKAVDHLKLPQDITEWIITPERSMMVSLPIRMDDKTVKTFYGYRVQHNMALGPGKGGLRYHPSVNLGEVTALATWMTWKGD